MTAEGKTVGIISIKGGVGKTSCTANLAAALAQFGKKTLAVDANYSSPNLGMHFGVISTAMSLSDVMKKNIHASNAIHKHTDSLHLLPSSLTARKVNPLELKSKLKDVKNDYDIILIDSSPNLNHEMLSAIAASDELLVVTTPDYPTLSSTMHAIKVARRRKTPIAGLILNKVRNKKFELSIDDIENMCETPVLAALPDDLRMLESVAHARPVVHHAPNLGISVEYKKLAASLIGKEYRDTRFFARLTEIIRAKHSNRGQNRMIKPQNQGRT